MLALLTNSNAKGEYYLTDLVGLARKAGLRCGVVDGTEDELLGINSRSELATAEALVQSRLRTAAMDGGATLTDPASVFFSADTKIGQDVEIGPFTVFGPGVTIDDGASIRIVDWEYAGMGDRFFDFGNFAVNHQLSEGDEGRLLSAYFGRLTAAQHARLRLMRLMSDYREAMWGVLQQAISELDFDFAAYAGKHFDRLLTAAGDPRYDDWLRQAAG